MYTSGTTGEPKGVILNNAAISVQVLSIDKMLEVTDRSVIFFLQFISIDYIFLSLLAVINGKRRIHYVFRCIIIRD